MKNRRFHAKRPGAYTRVSTVLCALLANQIARRRAALRLRNSSRKTSEILDQFHRFLSVNVRFFGEVLWCV